MQFSPRSFIATNIRYGYGASLLSWCPKGRESSNLSSGGFGVVGQSGSPPVLKTGPSGIVGSNPTSAVKSGQG